MFRSRTSLHSFALWLALSAVVLRSLIPVGFMPGWTGSSGGESASWLIICPASPLSAALAPKASSHAGHPHHDHAAMLAAMAAATSTGNGDPHAGHHAGMDHDAATMSVAAVDPHAGHDPAAHLGHRIASEHQSCPFAGAVAPALPVSVAAYVALIADALASRPATAVGVVAASQRRLPPARAPPVAIDTRSA